MEALDRNDRALVRYANLRAMLRGRTRARKNANRQAGQLDRGVDVKAHPTFWWGVEQDFNREIEKLERDREGCLMMKINDRRKPVPRTQLKNLQPGDMFVLFGETTGPIEGEVFVMMVVRHPTGVLPVKGETVWFVSLDSGEVLDTCGYLEVTPVQGELTLYK